MLKEVFRLIKTINHIEVQIYYHPLLWNIGSVVAVTDPHVLVNVHFITAGLLIYIVTFLLP
jgi:hypothetical protein